MDETRDIELAEQAVELEAQAPWPLIEASGLGLATSRGVLFEGIEDANDEENCVKMSARYLQGYKYSKPIPIEELSRFLPKAS